MSQESLSLSGDTLGDGIELLLAQMEPGESRLLQLCAIPHEFSIDTLSVLEPGLDAAQAAQFYEEFSQLSLIHSAPGGLALHDDARRRLFEKWLGPPTDPEFTAAGGRLVAYFEQRLETARGDQKETLRRQRLFHLLGAQPEAGFKEFERLFGERYDEYLLSDCETLLSLVHEYDRVLPPEWTASLTFYEGELAIEARAWERAEAAFRRVLDAQTPSPKLQVKVYIRLGQVKAEQRHWENAVTLYRKALVIATEHSETEGLIYQVLFRLGTTYRDSGNLEQALAFLMRSLKQAERMNSRAAQANVYNSLGTVYSQRGDYDQALEAYSKSLDYLREGKLAFRQSKVYNNIGELYTTLKRWPESEQALQQSLRIKREAGDTYGQAVTLVNLIPVYQAQGKAREAAEAAEQAIKFYRELRETYGVAQAKHALGRAYAALQQPERARQSLSEAVHLYENGNADQKAAEARGELAHLPTNRP